MLKQLILFIVFSLPLLCWSQSPWINEFHYDNAGVDASECIEIAGIAGTNVTGYSIVLYNGSNSLTYDTDVLAGTIPDEGCGYGTISLCYAVDGIQNGAPDGIALVNSGGTVIQFLSYEGVITAADGPASGMTSTNVGVTETGTTLVGTSIQLTGSGSSYASFTWSTGAVASQGSLNSGQTITPCATPNTITTGAITGGPFSVDCFTSDAGTIAFTTVGTFNVGNTFTAQLSTAAGAFTSPVDIGTFSGAAAEGIDPSGTINITIPAGSASGVGYLIRIVASGPGSVSGNTTGTTITLTGTCNPPHLTSVIINACNGLCSDEGYNELIFGTTGDYSVLVNTTNFNFSYGSSSPASIKYTDVLVTNLGTTDLINTAAGCPANYVEGTGATMPPGSKFILADKDVCVDALTWSGLCGIGPIYMIYQDDSDWSIGGNFSNSTSAGFRYFNTTMKTTTGETFSIDYNYDRTMNSGTDGDFVTYGPAGGAPLSYQDDDCVINPIVLPIELLDFAGTYSNRQTLLDWKTLTEQNSDYFIIGHSTTGYNFEEIGVVHAAVHSEQQLEYHFIHQNPEIGLNYYRLMGVDLNGMQKNHGIVAVNADMNFVYFDAINQAIVLGESKHVKVYGTDGRLVAESGDDLTIPFSHKGMFLVVDQVTGITQKIIAH